MNCLKGLHHWTFHKFSYIFQAFYFFYLISGFLIIRFQSYFILEQYCRTSYRSFLCVLLFSSGILSFFTCSLSDPGKISLISLDKHMKFYSYDEIIFHANRKCETCHILKPARSKHCKYCSSCIPRYDHHCFLLNNCIGGYNSIYYFVFIYINIAITFYASYITSLCLYSIIKYENLLEATFIDKETKEVLPNTYLTIANYLFSKYSPTFSLFVISLFSFFFLILLFSHEMYFNFYLNITTNEKKKYSQLKNSFSLNKQFYNKGFIKNVKDVLFYKKNVNNFLKKIS
ncbi:palmitoyltransferase DHHC12, putative [Plasmodium malariae]|uniref:Palmitoyltransferase n=1 Tax=Plasmodium malariae TaxID=5858 RepID=A0A1C3KAU4_PLAMA|nr:palmitoyltransferase DHHC12, putative [Plasmodium malariae]